MTTAFAPLCAVPSGDRDPRSRSGAGLSWLAASVTALMLLCAPAIHAQAAADSVVVTLGSAPVTLAAPGTRFSVPVMMTPAAPSPMGGGSVASFAGVISWRPGRLVLDSVTSAFGSLTTNAGADQVSIALFSAAGVTSPTTLAQLHFTAAASAGGTPVSLLPTQLGDAAGGSLLSKLRFRGLDACIAPLGRRGDANGDGTVNIIDAQQIARFAVGLPVAAPVSLAALGDANADATVNIIDAQQVARFGIGLPASPRIATDAPVTAAVAALSLSAAGTVLSVGERAPLSATPTDSAGIPLTGCVPLTWATSDASVATVDAAGVVTAIAPGAVTLTAATGARTGTFALTTVNSAATVVLAPDTATVRMGDTLRLAPTVLDRSGAVLAGQTVTYLSSDTSIAIVTAAGVVHTRTVGLVTITAQSGTRTGSAKVQVSPLPGASLVTAESSSCVLTVTGEAYCWGSPTGDGSTTARLTPVRVATAPGVRFTQISGTSSGVCGLTSAAQVFCWGNVGTGTTSNAPALITTTLRARSIAVGFLFGCAIDLAGQSVCWGDNRSGKLATGDTVSSVLPRPVIGSPVFAQLSGGLFTGCALNVAGAAECWGSNSFRQLGVSTTPAPTGSLVPVSVEGGLNFVSLGVGSVQTCGTVASGAAYCWGTGRYGAAGRGDTVDVTQVLPTAVTGGVSFRSVHMGTGNNILTSICGLAVDGTAYCWGNNRSGQLGTTAPLPGACTFQAETFGCTGTPTPVETTEKFSVLSVGSEQTCGITTTRRLLCWGRNTTGQVGDGTTINKNVPTLVAGNLRVP